MAAAPRNRGLNRLEPNMRLLLIGVAAASLLAGQSAMAQTLQAVAPTQAAAGGFSVDVGVRGPVDPVRLELARQIIEASGGEAAEMSRVKALFGGMEAMSDQTADAGGAQIAHLFYADLQAELQALAPRLMRIGEEAYARDFTEQQLRDDLAWVSSPSGQAFAHKSSQLTGDVVDAERPLLADALPKIMNRVVDDVCAQESCSDDQRAAIADGVQRALHGHAAG
jgi:hypothetical protein